MSRVILLPLLLGAIMVLLLLLAYAWYRSWSKVSQQDGFGDGVGRQSRKVALLLTACVTPMDCDNACDSRERLAAYMRSIKFYTDTTSLPVLVVESSGHVFDVAPGAQVSQLAFRLEPQHQYTRSAYEALSILEAHRAGLFEGYDLIVKVTGKYALPGLEAELARVPESAGVVYQARQRDEGWQHSEVVGFEPRLAEAIFRPVADGGLIMEQCLAGVHAALGVSAHRLSPLAPDPPMQRGDGSTLEWL